MAEKTGKAGKTEQAADRISVEALSGTAGDTADYAARVSSAAQRAASALKTAAGRTGAGYERLKQQAVRDYNDITARRASLTSAAGTSDAAGKAGKTGETAAGRTTLGTSQAGGDALAQQNAIGALDAAGKAAVSSLTDAADSLTTKARRSTTAAEAQQEALLRELSLQEAQRSGSAARADYEQQQTLAQSQAEAQQSQEDARTSYLRQLGLICLQLGYVPGDDMLDALGIDAATAKSFAKYYWRYGY